MILLVEDNPDDERLALRAYDKSGLPYRLEVARDGEEAIQAFQSNKEGLRLVLLDLKLPKIGGLEVLRRIRDARGECPVPVVVLTSSDETNDIRQSYRLGANSYLRKPVDFEQFNRMFTQALRYWMTVNCPPT